MPFLLRCATHGQRNATDVATYLCWSREAFRLRRICIAQLQDRKTVARAKAGQVFAQTKTMHKIVSLSKHVVYFSRKLYQKRCRCCVCEETFV